jgi:hypothetical protein
VEDGFPGRQRAAPLLWDLARDQVEIASYELLLLSTELAGETTGFVASDETTSALNHFRAALYITRRNFKTMMSNLMPTLPADADPVLVNAPPTSLLYRLAIVLYMRPKNFLTGDGLE